MDKIKQYAKFIAALLTAAVSAVAQFAVPVPEGVLPWVQLVVAVLGAVAVYGVPNASEDPGTDPEFDDVDAGAGE